MQVRNSVIPPATNPQTIRREVRGLCWYYMEDPKARIHKELQEETTWFLANLANKRFHVGKIKEAGNCDRCTINHANHSS